MSKKAFTLLEIIIVIIIIGVLASLGLPRLFAVVEGSRAAEAIAAISSLRTAMERCYIMNNQSYGGCTVNTLDIENPTFSPNSHFTYSNNNIGHSDAYCLVATRNTRDNGDGSSVIEMCLGQVETFESGSWTGGYDSSNTNVMSWTASAKYKGFVPEVNTAEE